jgi:hypothetical protein
MMENIGFAEAFPALARTASANGSAVDLASEAAGQHQAFIGAGPGGRALKAILSVGAKGGTTPTLNVKLQYSADGSTGWTDITGATFTELDDEVGRQEIHFIAPERYVRAVATIAGGGGETFTFAVLILGVERYG